MSFFLILVIKYIMLKFNYFSELIQKFKIKSSSFEKYNIVNIGGEYVFIENHKELLKLSDTVISFKLKNGYVEVKGNDMQIEELDVTSVMIKGKIYKIEVF